MVDRADDDKGEGDDCFVPPVPPPSFQHCRVFPKMKSQGLLATALGALAFIAPSLAAVPKITRSGKYLYAEDGSRFFIKVCSRFLKPLNSTILFIIGFITQVARTTKAWGRCQTHGRNFSAFTMRGKHRLRVLG